MKPNIQANCNFGTKKLDEQGFGLDDVRAIPPKGGLRKMVARTQNRATRHAALALGLGLLTVCGAASIAAALSTTSSTGTLLFDPFAPTRTTSTTTVTS